VTNICKARKSSCNSKHSPCIKVATVFFPVCFHDLFNGLFSCSDDRQPGQKRPQTILLPVCMHMQLTTRPSLEITPTTLVTLLADCGKFVAGCYLFSILNFDLLFSTVSHPSSCWALASCCDRELWPMTLISELDLDDVPANQKAKYLSQRSIRSKVIVQTHTLNRLLYLDH